MKLVDVSNLIPKNGTVALISDIHEGVISRADCIYDAIERCEKKKSKVFLGGDLIEGRWVHHPYYDKAAQEGKFKCVAEQAKSVAKMLRPIKKNIIATGVGNHEESQSLREIIDVSGYIHEQLGIKRPHGYWSIKAKIGEDRLFYTHGSGSVNSMAGDAKQRYDNDVRKIRRKLRDLAGDCVVMAIAHIHKLRIGKPIEELTIVEENGKQKEVYTTIDMYRKSGLPFPETLRWYCSTGSFFRGYMEDVTTYVERAGYAPTELGYIEIQMHQGKVVDVREVKL